MIGRGRQYVHGAGTNDGIRCKKAWNKLRPLRGSYLSYHAPPSLIPESWMRLPAPLDVIPRDGDPLF